MDVSLTTAEVAALFRVDQRTVGRWADAGRLVSFRTVGGHRRFRRADIDDALAHMDQPPTHPDKHGATSTRSGSHAGTDPADSAARKSDEIS